MRTFYYVLHVHLDAYHVFMVGASISCRFCIEVGGGSAVKSHSVVLTCVLVALASAL